jgi:hypothetical protein
MTSLEVSVQNNATTSILLIVSNAFPGESYRFVECHRHVISSLLLRDNTSQ